jgi:hypothetical protein
MSNELSVIAAQPSHSKAAARVPAAIRDGRIANGDQILSGAWAPQRQRTREDSLGRKFKFACQASKFCVISNEFVSREHHQ